jgi:rhamnosyltransferase
VSAAQYARILAAVVTYHPPPELAANLAALRAELADVVVIDNGSPDAATIAATAAAAGCRFIGNAGNLGVATALNQGVRLAQSEGFAWFAAFDQDSRAPPGAVARLLALHDRHPERARIGVLAMSHRDRNTGRNYQHGFDVIARGPGWRSLRATITSGSLTRVDLFDDIGAFEDELFIDGVDHEFCLRCRMAGRLVIEDEAVVLEHAIGEATLHRLLWLSLPIHHHAPVRHYYITRNGLELARRYVARDFLWAAQNAALVIAGRAAAVLVDKGARGPILKAIGAGGRDFLRRRFGPYPGG